MFNITNMCNNGRNNFKACERKSFQINHTRCKYLLQSLQGQLDD